MHQHAAAQHRAARQAATASPTRIPSRSPVHLATPSPLSVQRLQAVATSAVDAAVPGESALIGSSRPVQLMRRNPARNRGRSSASRLQERMMAGADRYSIAGGVLAGGTVAAIAAANSWNPIGWGLGAALAGTALLSYMRGPANADRAADRRLGLENYDEATDREWTPQDVAARHLQRARDGDAQYPLETEARDWDGGSHLLDAGSGPFRFHRGRGNQPYIRTNMANYGNARVDDDYDAVAQTLSHHDPEVEEERAHALQQMARGEHVDVSHEPHAVRRAMSFLLGITQVAEESTTRTAGSAGAARSSLGLIADGTSTFHEQFNRTDGHYVPARHGGTQQMREVGTGHRQLHDDLAGNMSDDESS